MDSTIQMKSVSNQSFTQPPSAVNASKMTRIIRLDNKCNSPVITITNIKKRHLNEYDDDNSNKSPHKKKRKFNRNSINNKLKALMEANKLYKKQKNHYEQGLKVYKKEANKWKIQYMKLYSQLQNITNSTD
eukprot:402667_1